MFASIVCFISLLIAGTIMLYFAGKTYSDLKLPMPKGRAILSILSQVWFSFIGFIATFMSLRILALAIFGTFDNLWIPSIAVTALTYSIIVISYVQSKN